jgi:hypothetical protein
MKLHSKKSLLSIFIACFVLLWIFSIKSYEVRHDKHLSLPYSMSKHRHRPVTVADIAYISPWMTFDYISTLFNIPEDYLKQSMSIEDEKYPYITLDQYAKKSDINVDVLIANIRHNIKEYLLISQTPK